MANRLNPAEKTAAESDYDKKFNKDVTAEAKEIKEKEAAPDAEWKTVTTKKSSEDTGGRGRFGFVGRGAGKLRKGSAFGFIIGVVAIGVVYTSVFAPNIILVNLKEMYTNDLADATLALNTYYWKVMNLKLGHSDCGDQKSIKCKLTTMSRVQKQAFEKNGFTVLGNKVSEDNRDDSQPDNDKKESRYQVTAILPPKYKQVIDDLKSSGLSFLTSGNLSGLQSAGSQFAQIGQSALQGYTQDLLSNAPIATGDMLWLYSQLSSGTKAQVYSVFNPKSSFFLDTKFRERLKTKYDLNKSMTVGGTTEAEVNQSFDSSLTGGSEGIGLDGEPNTTGGISLGSLANPATAAQLEAAGLAIAATSTSYVGLQCSWYAFAKAVTNDAKTAKAHTIARFAMQYLKAADQVKVGTSDDITINTLSSKLAESTGGGYNGPNATDDSMYKSIVYGSLPIPSPYGFLYYEDTFDLIGALMPAWLTIMASAKAEGAASNAPGSLSMPPASLSGGDRDYCLSGETTASKAPIKEAECKQAILASALPGTEGLLDPALEVGRKTCPHTKYDAQDNTFAGGYTMQPSLTVTKGILTPIMAGIFSANVIAWANIIKLPFSSQTKGVAASDAIFAGTGEILGDMAMSRGMQPANAATMGVYLAQKSDVEKNFDDVARYNAKNQPFDAYNRFSFLGSIVHSLNPTYDSKTPLFSTLANAFSLVSGSVNQLNQNANAFYFSQPIIPDIDPLNPVQTGIQHATGLAQYLLRLNCPDPEYLAIQIMADTACNVRYVMGKQEMLASPDSVLDYMTKSHSDLTQDNINELTKRAATAATLAEGEPDQANIQRMLTNATNGANATQIDKETGRANPNTEYEKYLNYCVNRQDPWGRSGVAVTYSELSPDQRTKLQSDKQDLINAISPSDSGDPYKRTANIPFAAVTEGASADQDWYTGKKCMEQSEELTNFRAYTMLCSVDGSLSGGVDCTDNDNSVSTAYSNNFYTSNDILYMSYN
jgi:hypothetical protein